MGDLYTSQVHLKRLLAGQATPAFTAASSAVLKVLDPAFFPGMGALNEDEHGRVQCPVRECGVWMSNLGQHLSMRHAALGGAAGIRAALGIPVSVGLCSARVRKVLFSRGSIDTARAKAMGAARKLPRNFKGVSASQRNWADTCPAQLQARIVALARETGQSPSVQDFRRRYGYGTLKSVVNVFGSWNAAKALCGLDCSKSERALASDVCESLSAWIEVHGDLPSPVDAQRTDRAPRIPSYRTILKAFGADTWDAAMRSAIAHIGIRSERYGGQSRRSA